MKKSSPSNNHQRRNPAVPIENHQGSSDTAIKVSKRDSDVRLLAENEKGYDRRPQVMGEDALRCDHLHHHLDH